MRALLAFLLLHANELVSSDRLIDEVWGPEPPKTAGASLQNYVSRLRKAIGSELIVSRSPGYVLQVDPERLDLGRFERLATEARGAPPAERAAKLRAALALWRASALEDLAFEPCVRDDAARLDEARLAALEQRIDADLSLGQGADLVPELEMLAEAHPLRERIQAQLMLALYRAGRQADALEAFTKARQTLLDDLGLEPGDELKNLQRRILEQDGSLLSSAEIVRRTSDRRTVTILFCDLVDSTRLATDLDPEVYREVLSRYFELVKNAVAAHGGAVEKFIGDAVLAVFGVPELHEDDALRAVRAAVDAQAALKDEKWDLPLAARIGVSTGEVHVLSASDEDLRVSGAPASVAAKLEDQAPIGGVLLEEATYRLVRHAVRADRVENGWLLTALVPGAAPDNRRSSAALVGRGAELQRLLDAYEDSRRSSHCRVVTVLGEAGIGKTRLIRELLARVRSHAKTLVGRCVSYGEGATYLPIAEIVRQAAPAASVAGLAALFGDSSDGEQVAQRVAELTGLSEGPGAPEEAFWAVRRFLEAVAGAGPAVIVIEDIHWAEPTLLDLIEYLGEWGEVPLLVACAARPELLDARPGWGGPNSSGFVVPLEPLPAQQLSDLVSGLADTPLDPALKARIVEHAGGNPLFAEQLVELSTEAPELALDDPPPSVEALLASRLDRLGSEELGALRRAAVIGRRFSRGELQDISPEDGESTARVLSELTRRGLVHPAGEVYRFHHVLLRDVAYRSLPKTDRAGLHELAAEGLARRDGLDELVGFHLERAHTYLVELGREPDRARELAKLGGERLGDAGLRAWKRADCPAALNLLSRALRLTPGAGALSAELALALNVSGQREQALDVLAEVSEAAEEHVRLRAALEQAYLRSMGEPDLAGDLLHTAETAIPILEQSGDDRALGRAWLCVAHVRGGFYCDYGAQEEAAQRVATCYRRAGWSVSAPADHLGGALYFGPRPVETAIDLLNEFVDADTADLASQANAAMWLGGLESMRGNFDEARSHVELAATIYRDLGLTRALADDCPRMSSLIELNAGFPADAANALRDACTHLEELHQTAVLATRAAELAVALYEGGQHDEAAHWVRRARQWASAVDLDATLTRQPVEAKLLARRGDLAEAEALARATLAASERTDSLSRQADARVALAEVLELAGAREEGRDHLTQALALHELKGNVAAATRLRERAAGLGAPT